RKAARGICAPGDWFTLLRWVGCAVAGWFMIWVNFAVCAPVAAEVLWFCSMSITTSAPLLSAVWFCVMLAVALTVEVSVWFCASALLLVLQAAVVPESTAAFSALFGPLFESCVIVTDC